MVPPAGGVLLLPGSVVGLALDESGGVEVLPEPAELGSLLADVPVSLPGGVLDELDELELVAGSVVLLAGGVVPALPAAVSD